MEIILAYKDISTSAKVSTMRWQSRAFSLRVSRSFRSLFLEILISRLKSLRDEILILSRKQFAAMHAFVAFFEIDSRCPFIWDLSYVSTKNRCVRQDFNYIPLNYETVAMIYADSNGTGAMAHRDIVQFPFVSVSLHFSLSSKRVKSFSSPAGTDVELR
jgi:hypothetical protein